MTGKEVKEKLEKIGFRPVLMANALGITEQALHSLFKTTDIKTGVLQKIAEAANKSVYFFYEGMPENEKSPLEREPLNEIADSLKDLAGTVKRMEANLLIHFSDNSHKQHQSHKPDRMDSERKDDPGQIKAIEDDMVRKMRQAKAIAKRKKQQGG